MGGAGVHVVVDRAQQHDLHAAPLAVREMLADGVAVTPPGTTDRFFRGRPPNATSRSVSRAMTVPRRRPAPHRVRAADDVAQRDVRGRGRVGAHARRRAAEQAVEATQLALRVVEAARARPAVGAGVDGRVAVLADDAPELGRRAVEGLLPADGDPLVGAAAGVGPGPVLEPPAADRGVRDARPPVAGHDVVEERGGQRVVRVRIDADELVVAHLCGVGAPVRCVRCTRHVGHRVTRMRLGLDIGTSAVKALLVGEDGAVARHGPGAVHRRHPCAPAVRRPGPRRG